MSVERICEGSYPITDFACNRCDRLPSQSCGRRPPDRKDSEITRLRVLLDRCRPFISQTPATGLLADIKEALRK